MIDYSSWVSERPCDEEEAACLISEIEPEKFRNKKSSYSGEIEKKVLKLSQLFQARVNRRVPMSIIYFVNIALKNNTDISERLLSELEIYTANLIEDDKERFLNKYPYLTRTLKLTHNEISEKKSSEELFYQSDTFNRLKSLACKAIDKYPEYLKSRPKHKTMRKADMEEWIKKNIASNTREINVIKKILSEVYENNQ